MKIILFSCLPAFLHLFSFQPFHQYVPVSCLHHFPSKYFFPWMEFNIVTQLLGRSSPEAVSNPSALVRTPKRFSAPTVVSGTTIRECLLV